MDIRETDRKPGWLKGEWGQGSWYTGPSPWVTLLLSFCALVSLGDCCDPPPSSPIHTRPYSGRHPPSTPSEKTTTTKNYSPLLFSGKCFRFQPSPCQNSWRQHFHEHAGGGAHEDPGLYWETACFCALSRHSPPSRCPPPSVSAASVVNKWNKKQITRTLVKSHGSFQSPPETVTSGVQTLWAWSVFIFFCFFVMTISLLLYVDCVCSETKKSGRHWERSDRRIIPMNGSLRCCPPHSQWSQTKC